MPDGHFVMPVRRTAARRKRHARRTGQVSQATRQYVRRMMPKTELKTTWVHDNEISLNTLAQGLISSGPAITNGTAPTSRVGNEIRAQSLHLRGVLYSNSTQESYVRMLVVGCDGSVDPTVSLFRTGALGGTAGISTVNGLDTIYFPVNKLEFKVYADKVFKLGASAAGTAGSNTRTFSKFIKFGGKKVQYKGNVAGLDLQSWQYHVIWIAADGNDDTTTGTTVELSQITRFWFTDA